MSYILFFLLGLFVGSIINIYIYKVEKLEINSVIKLCILPVITAFGMTALFMLYSFTAQFISYAVLFGLLLAIAAVDLMIKLISRGMLILCYSAGIICLIAFNIIPFWDGIIASILIGLLLFILRKAAKGGIGLGDIYLLSSMGLFLGVERVFTVLCTSGIIGGIFGILLLLIKKENKKREIPFVPFIFIGYIITIFI